MGKFFNWPPFVAVPIDADTRKPLDPNVGMRVKREFYNVGKDGKGKKVMIAHKTGSAAAAEDGKKEYGGKKEGNGNGKGKGKNGGGDKKDNAAGAGGAGEKVSHFTSSTYLLCVFARNLDHLQHTDNMATTQKVAEAPFTDEDDATLKRMKDEKKSWNEIIEVLGRNKKVLQDRFKEINGGGGNDTKEDENKDNGKKGGNGNGEGKKDKFDNKKESKKQDKKPEPAKPAAVKAGSVAGSNGQARFTMNEWMTLQEDDVFSFGELQCLSELMLRDERHRWTRLASAFYDKTGRRVHPDDIRDKFGEMSAVGSQK
jgi:predicted CopG family antitoxin